MEICRLCLHENPEDLTMVRDEALISEIKEFVSIEIVENDELSNFVCNLCIAKIDDFVLFKLTCLEATETLKKTSEERRKIVNEDPLSDNSQDQENIYNCDICQQNFSALFEYLDHQYTHNGQPVFTCDQCFRIFESREELVQHERKHEVVCPHCEKMMQKGSLKMHLLKHAGRHKCLSCLGTFSSRAALSDHITTVHKKLKNHICEICGKKFPSKGAISTHMKSHSDERPYKCKLCQYSGRTASALYAHMTTHSEDVCICEVCSKTFKSIRHFNDHRRRVHSKLKKHQCSYCDKKFVAKYKMTVHMRTHTGVKPYSCNLCTRNFVRSDALKEHLETHGERVSYHCSNCARKFVTKKGVARHNCTGVTLIIN